MTQEEMRQLKESNNETKWGRRTSVDMQEIIRLDSKLMRQYEYANKWNKIHQGKMKRDRWDSKKEDTVLRQGLFSFLITAQSLQEARRSLSADRVLSL